ncbi:MAG TPA: efflux RND transporter periplasmic adaptor subunit [Gemmatimonadales bacterium]|nr:efflux RND transporter periplasmic adaptor subunit [Gemmatimonadales bacterium]
MTLAALAGVTGCGGDGRAESEAAAGAAAGGAAARSAATLGASDVAVATRATLTEGVALSGALEPKVNYTVAAPVAEQIAQVFVDEGEPVREGQPLVRFRDEVLRAAAASARADVARARMAVSLAVAESSRAVALFAEGAIARRDHDNAFLAVESARAQLALAEAQSASATDRLEQATLRAPSAGVISRRYVQAGDRVDMNARIVDIVDTRTLQLSASVETQWLRLLRIGSPVTLALAQGLDSVRGRVSRINPTADPATRQVRVYVDIPNPGNRLVGGLYVSGRAVVNEARGVVAVPSGAVRLEGGGRSPVVYVVDSGVVRRRPVTVGVNDEVRALTQISSGLAEGDTVIVGPVEGLEDGTRVEIAGRRS